MKILYILHETNPYSGSSKSFMTLCDALRSQGVEMMVVVPDSEGNYSRLLERGVAVEVLNYKVSVCRRVNNAKERAEFLPRLMARITLNNVATRKLMQIAKGFAPDIIHTNVSIIDVGYRVATKLGIPHIYHLREYGDLDFGYSHYPSKRAFLRRLNSPNSYSIAITRDISRHNNLLDNEASQVIYNGVMSMSEATYTPSKEPYFLYVGALSSAKGVDTLIESFSEFVKNQADSTPFRLLVAGDGKSTYRQELESLTHKLGIESRVEFLGQSDDVHSLMALSSAVIVPSHAEAFGRVAPEAMFNGALVVGRNKAGTKEQFDNGVNHCGEEIALRYESGEELVAIMEQIALRGAGDYRQMVDAAQKTVCELYSKEGYVQRIYDFYKRII